MIAEQINSLSLDYQPQIVDPDDFVSIEKYAAAYYELRNRKGLSLHESAMAVKDPNVFAPLMVKMGDAEACVSGLTYDYPDVIRPALQFTIPRMG